MEANESSKPVDGYEVLGMMLQQCVELSWQKLGLQPDFMTGKISPDLSQAKALIDAASAIGDILLPQLEDGDRRTVQNSIRDLRVNYVQRLQSGDSQ